MRAIERRLRRLETGAHGLPWHLPVEQWNDADLTVAIGMIPTLTDAQLHHLAGDDA